MRMGPADGPHASTMAMACIFIALHQVLPRASMQALDRGPRTRN